MNILLQSAGLVVMLTIFIFYFIDRKAEVRSNRQFLYFSIAIFISLILDILSLLLIDHFYLEDPGTFQSSFTRTICKLYCFSCVVVTYFSFLYVIQDIFYDSKKKFRLYAVIQLVVVIIGFAAIMSTRIIVHKDADGYNDYTEGLPVIFTYVFTFITMISTIIFVIIKRKKMYKKRIIGVIIYLSVWAVGSLVQAFVNYIIKPENIIILTVGFSEAIGAMDVYIMLENPSLNIDKITGALNQRAFSEYLDYCYDNKKNVQIIVIDYDTSIASSLMGYNTFALKVNNYLKKFKVKKIFKTDSNKFIAIRSKKKCSTPIGESVKTFKEAFYKDAAISQEVPVRIVHISDIFLFHNTIDILSGISYIYGLKKYANKELIEVTEDLVIKLHEKFIIDEKCSKAFANQKYIVHYQPIYSVRHNKFTSAEALVRLIDDDNSLISPAHFIEEMEKDGRIIELGKMVFEDVCKFISTIDMDDFGLDYIEVNLSTVQCGQEDLAESYINIMEKYNVNPKYINLEITETGAAVRQTLLRNMEILRNYGVSFSLDDFGTGNSNLNYIVEMPVEIVKFDKSMVISFFENKIATYVMSSTINMIKQLGHKIVFEGIEQEKQVRTLEPLDVDYIQGYYYSRPIDKEHFKEFLVDNNK